MPINRKVSLLLVGVIFCGCVQKKYEFKGENESERINHFFDWSFDQIINRMPEEMAYLGIEKRQGDLNDVSAEYAAQTAKLFEEHLKILNSFSRSELNRQDQLSYDVYKYTLKSKINEIHWRDYDYSVEQMFGIQSHLPNFMTSVHKIESKMDAQNYISRLNQFKNVLNSTVNNLMRSEAKGVVLPKFVFIKVIRDCENILKGRPFQKVRVDSFLLKDFKSKLNKIKITKSERKILMTEVEQALLTSVGSGYKNLISFLKKQEKRATTDDGAWKFPKGEEFYRYRIGHMTTTNLSPDQVHEMGLKNVKRIQGEMRGVIKKIGFKGSLQDFFKHLQTSKFYFKNSKKGKAAYIKKVKQIIENMNSRLDDFFVTKPKSEIEVLPVEAYREKSAGLAFYQNGSPDGTRPGRYYVNLSRMKALPTWELEALAYHEGVPGHHMQVSIAQEYKGMPKFRRYLTHFTAYTEGWALYSERFPKEFGFYEDPYSDFGRLSMEIFRAARLVVDSGIHWKKWTRKQAVEYLVENTPGNLEGFRRAIDRYTIWPGQATGYMIGMLKILELREKGQRELKTKFNLRKFHDLILKSGSVPLSILENRVDGFIRSEKNKNFK